MKARSTREDGNTVNALVKKLRLSLLGKKGWIVVCIEKKKGISQPADSGRTVPPKDSPKRGYIFGHMTQPECREGEEATT